MSGSLEELPEAAQVELLLRGAAEGRADIVQKLVRANPGLASKAADRDGCSPLHLA
eukprot:CAMPEP_0172621796 /NCGR_PEP_ID=MMETSP1068-20121228/115453_1 /TAXON_ID=35684 /ORGANISM="Pseudopedinella elastica, Strain CCMP716" /LENGTH=55 /DNA_ID=CAMNT_0013429713 /DNA_START=99 /DNA_END=262 /DNA_ORIENTATION=-